MKRTLSAVAGAVLLVASGASSALTFNITFLASTSAQGIQGFNEAAAVWSNLLSDNVTVNLTLGTAALGSGILAQANSTRATFSYTDFRTALAADATSATDVQAVSSLPLGPSFGLMINRTTDNPNGANSATPFLDTTGANTQTIRMTTANAKAAGLLGTTAANDATITFATGFTYDFDRTDGVITPGTFDFVGLAIHEIGHALGFVSGVDTLVGNPTGFSSDAFTFVNSLDLFRYSALSSTQSAFGKTGVLDFSADTRVKYFSLDNGVTAGPGFSTGSSSSFGDGRQASHWKDNLGLGVMDPTAGTGELLVITANDHLAFDAIGWNLATAVPEPGTYALFGLGLAAIGLRRRRTAAQA